MSQDQVEQVVYLLHTKKYYTGRWGLCRTPGIHVASVVISQHETFVTKKPYSVNPSIKESASHSSNRPGLTYTVIFTISMSTIKCHKKTVCTKVQGKTERHRFSEISNTGARTWDYSQDAPMDRLQAISTVWQSPTYNHRHCICQVGF